MKVLIGRGVPAAVPGALADAVLSDWLDLHLERCVRKQLAAPAAEPAAG